MSTMKKPRTPKEPVKATNIFQCTKCSGNPEFDGLEAFKNHLVEIHQVSDFKGQRKMVMHLDCADSYHSTFEWTLSGGLTFKQFCTNPRHKHDLMRFEE